MYQDIYKNWVASKLLSNDELKELASISDNDKEIEYRFGKDLEFGTAGMRGFIGLGTNMMNVYTVKRATQGLCEYIKTLGERAKRQGVVISYDTRRMSYEFAYSAAVVLASNGIKTYIFNDVHPVPMLSYAVRELGTVAGIMITASHNPKEYNGYKVYGADGAQMSPEDTEKVVHYINEIGDCLSDKILFEEKLAKNIKVVRKGLDKKYYKTIKKLSLSPREVKKVGKTIKLVYTPVHGSGYIPVTTILKKMGITATLVPEQTTKDTEFSTVKVPNPEIKETLTLGIKMADFKNADVVFGTDPDCDRLGVAVRNDKGEFVALSGNQTGILLLDYVLRRLKETGKLTKKGFAVKSFVSTGMAKLIADDYGVELIETPVGFKFIGEKIKQLDDTGKREFVFGFEESCGYLRGTHCRDKDAVVASMLFAEMVCYYTYYGEGIYERLTELYKKYGYVFDTNVSIQYSGLNAMKEMNAVVDKLKTMSIESIGDMNVLATRDYSKAEKRFQNGDVEEIDSPKCNAVYYELDGGSFICIRPSGTEPKIKVYYSLKSENEEQAIKLFEKTKLAFEDIIK
ncbi:MAG: phospho-sugar mutase [Clostridia bacterium]|nr:phospho-sugar mutase [Clostridia bacterium]